MTLQILGRSAGGRLRVVRGFSRLTMPIIVSSAMTTSVSSRRPPTFLDSVVRVDTGRVFGMLGRRLPQGGCLRLRVRVAQWIKEVPGALILPANPTAHRCLVQLVLLAKGMRPLSKASNQATLKI